MAAVVAVLPAVTGVRPAGSLSRAPLAVLLLPQRLERFALREPAADLLRAPGVAAVEPGLLPATIFARVPERTARRLAARQARRLLRGLPGRPAAVVLFDAVQWPLARELTGRVHGCELWLAGGAAGDAPEAFGDEAAQASALVFDAEEPAGAVTALLRERLHALGVDAAP